MSTLLSVLQNASNALDVFQRQIGVTQDNVVNASTPGYAKQQLSVSAVPILPAAGLFGGVQAGGIESARSQFAESSVRDALTQKGYQSERASTLSSISSNFDVTGDSGLSSALSGLFSAFSSWSESPTDSTQQQNVINAAQQFASSANLAASRFTLNEAQLQQATSSQVASINRLAREISDINASNQTNPNGASSNDAELNSTLEQLSELVNFTSLTASDGTVTVLLDGQSPLVVGSNDYPLSLSLVSGGTNNSPPQAYILDSTGNDITDEITAGKLGADLSVLNGDLASVLGASSQNGSLNQLVSTLATVVNSLLTSGHVDQSGTPGIALFTVATDATAASSIALNPACGAADLAAIQPGPPVVSNGIANQLAALSTASSILPGGQSFVAYYGNVAATLGANANSAQTAETRDSQLVSQAKSLRTQISGVSLDEEAASLVQIQQSYEASSRVFSAVNQLLDDLMKALAPI
jgi:flagellar hook-associated protein 1 FlgK